MHLLQRRTLGVHDVFHAFNSRRNGLMSCGELGAGLGWLGLPATEGQLLDLMRGLDDDGDGLLTLDEWQAALPESMPESEPSTQAPLTASPPHTAAA